MALTADQLTALKNADQRFRAHIAVFPAYTPAVTPAVAASATGTLLAPKPMVLLNPRYSTVNNSGTIDIYAGNSYLRGGGAAGTKNWSTDAGSLSAATGDTVTFTAPGAGSGIATITVTCDNAAGTTTAYAYVAYPKTTYDETVAEIATISGSLQQHGWKATIRVRGTASVFTIGKRVLVHIEDTWAGTVNTFGGYQYAEGVLVGYITEAEYFEDGSGESWLGIEVQSPWWVLGRAKIGELWWGYTAEGGKFYIPDFAPVDAIWKFVQDVTDFAKQHDVILWYDQNTIDDFITEESDLAKLFDDIMARTLSITYCDRYGSLFCVPDPDVRADEYWGTPASTYVMTPEFALSYRIAQQPYQVNKLTLAAFDSSKLGIYAISQNSTAPGTEQTIRGLLCDQGVVLASWAVQYRAKLNRPWVLEASHPLNHVLDLNNFVDAVFTAPAQAGAPTASAQVYAESINYRPDVSNGGWQGSIRYLKRTEGDGEAETGGVSSYGGTGNHWTGRGGFSGSGYFSGGGWGSSSAGPTFLHLFNFVNSNEGWSLTKHPNGAMVGSYVGGQGWKVAWSPGVTMFVAISVPDYSVRTITGIQMWGTVSHATNYMEIASDEYESGGGAIVSVGNQPIGNATVAYASTAGRSLSDLVLFLRLTVSGQEGYIKSALVGGFGGDPF